MQITISSIIATLQGILSISTFILWWFISREAEYESYRDGEAGYMDVWTHTWLLLLFIAGVIAFSLAITTIFRKHTLSIYFLCVFEFLLGLSFLIPGTDIWILTVLMCILAIGSFGNTFLYSPQKAEQGAAANP